METKTTNNSYIDMIILQDITTEQTFSFIPRSQTYDGMFITDEQLNTETEVTIVSNVNGDYYDTITAVFALVQDHFYKLELRNGTDVVYKGRIFCTNQPVATYSVNDGEYVSQASNNEFIIYE